MEQLDSLLLRLRNRHLALMQRTMKAIGHVIRNTPAADLTTYRDGGAGGWTALEALCHLRDFNAIFHERARSVMAEDLPHFVPRQHLQMVIDGQYNAQDPLVVLADMEAERARLVAFYEALTPEQLERSGVHPEYGLLTLYDLMQQVGHHDADHLEQITRTLLEKQR
ncbi:MAG: DinB family protein [Anaerolineae bacterium]|jgi:hypothetical protein|nr:DinB family protein [Anaerolineae bacterium]